MKTQIKNKYNFVQLLLIIWMWEADDGDADDVCSGKKRNVNFDFIYLLSVYVPLTQL